jgi:Tol biopolymer transport system component
MSPSENRLAYHRVLVESQGTDILTLPLDAGNPAVVTAGSADDYLPAWSPDGKRLTWLSSTLTDQGRQYRVVVGNLDGTGTKPISSGDGSDFQPLWAPAVK